MGDIVAAGVTYELLGQFPVTVPGVVRKTWKLTFPNSADVTYNATTGIPLSRAMLGYTQTVLSLRVVGRTPNAGASQDPYLEWNGNNSAPALMALETKVAGGGGAQELLAMKSIAQTLSQGAPVVLFVETEGY